MSQSDIFGEDTQLIREELDIAGIHSETDFFITDSFFPFWNWKSAYYGGIMFNSKSNDRIYFPVEYVAGLDMQNSDHVQLLKNAIYLGWSWYKDYQAIHKKFEKAYEAYKSTRDKQYEIELNDLRKELVKLEKSHVKRFF